MRAARTLPLVVAVSLAAGLLGAGALVARAQSVEEAESEAEDAAKQAEVASGLVDSALAERAEIEASLADSISRVSDLAAQLSTVSANVDRLRAQIGFADSELSGIQSDLEDQAVDAYMTALTMPGVIVVDSGSVEQALVATQVVDDVVNAGRERVDQLVVKRESLQQLQADYARDQAQVEALKAEVELELENLASLYESADAEVASAIREANAADAAFRSALSAVDAAQAREAERRRQEERGSTTTTAPEEGNPGTAPPTTTTTRPSTTTTEGTGSGGGGGPWDFPPAVERWRSLVAQYFPSNRVEEALRILQCESLGDPEAYNPYSGASGLFQFLPSTWAATSPKAGFPGASPFDPEANIGSAAWLANRYQELGKGYWQAWNCRRTLQ